MCLILSLLIKAHSGIPQVHTRWNIAVRSGEEIEKEPLRQTLACMSKCTVSGMGADTTVKVTGKECD